MLVLSRKKSQRIVIDGRVTVTVLEVRGSTVRLGIEAPPEVTVHRQEVLASIQNEADSRQPHVGASS